MDELVLIAGGGTMGAGIAFVAAQGGYGVDVAEPDAGTRERALERIKRDAARAGDDAIAARIAFLDAIPTQSAATIAIEAVPERFDLKRDVFAKLAAAIAPDAILATNTSSLCVADLAEAVPHPERVVGLHFFNPPELMKLVEVVHGAQTSDDAVEHAYEFAERIEKTAVMAADTPGFIVNRVARPFYLQSMRALELGAAPIAELDALARAAGFRMGPFELMDFIGLDVNLATSDSLYARTEAARFVPVEMQRNMVAQGLLGRKSGAGFYRLSYRHSEPRRPERAKHSKANGLSDESMAVIGFGGLADEIAELFGTAI